MSTPPKRPPTFCEEIAPWVRGRKLAVYLRGRSKPWTGLVVKYVGRQTIVARWNSSTHLIPLGAIDGIRYAPDNDPCRDVTHPLHSCMNNRRPQARNAARTSDEDYMPPDAPTSAANAIANKKRVEV